MEELVSRYEEMVLNGALQKYLSLSEQIGGDVKEQADLVRQAFQAQRDFIQYATTYCKPKLDADLQAVLQPTSEKLIAVQNFSEKRRQSAQFFHLEAVSQAISALGWVITNGPGNYVKELHAAGAYYGNKVIVSNKDKSPADVAWANAWLQSLKDLQEYIIENHKMGLQWNPKGLAPSGKINPSAPPPPPPPPPADLFQNSNSSNDADARARLFAEINKGADITKGLKRVDKGSPQQKVMSHIKSGNQNVAKSQTKPVSPPKMELDGRKWCIEHQEKAELKLPETSMNQSVSIYQCRNSIIQINSKVNCITLDSCKKTSVVFSDIVSFVEFINCQDMKAQAMGSVPTITADKVDGLQIYLGEKSIGTDIVSSKCSELNICLPTDDGDFKEFAVPEQLKTTPHKNGLNTVVVEKM